MTRISTIESLQGTLSNLQTLQAKTFEAQERLTTMMRVSKASDDPAAAARAERARAVMMRNESTQRSVDASTNAMTLAESALGEAMELIQQARELAVQAGNASYTDAERRNLATQLREIRLQLMGVANRTDGGDGYIFSGQGAPGAPFVDAPGGVRYTGSGGTMAVSGGSEPLPLTLDGGFTWLSASTGNGVFETSNVNSSTAWIDEGTVSDPSNLNEPYTIDFYDDNGTTRYTVSRGDGTTAVDGAYVDGQAIEIDGLTVTINGSPQVGDQFGIAQSEADLSVFDAMDALIGVLDAPADQPRSDAEVTQAVQQGLRDLDQVMFHMEGTRGLVGETLNRLEGFTTRLADSDLAAETARSNAEDLDMAKGITEFETLQTTYSAALQSYSMVQRLSLFDYIQG